MGKSFATITTIEGGEIRQEIVEAETMSIGEADRRVARLRRGSIVRLDKNRKMEKEQPEQREKEKKEEEKELGGE